MYELIQYKYYRDKIMTVFVVVSSIFLFIYDTFMRPLFNLFLIIVFNIIVCSVLKYFICDVIMNKIMLYICMALYY